MAAAQAIARAWRSRPRTIPYAGATAPAGGEAPAGPDFEAAGPDSEANFPNGSVVEAMERGWYIKKIETAKLHWTANCTDQPTCPGQC